MYPVQQHPSSFPASTLEFSSPFSTQYLRLGFWNYKPNHAVAYSALSNGLHGMQRKIHDCCRVPTGRSGPRLLFSPLSEPLHRSVTMLHKHALFKPSKYVPTLDSQCLDTCREQAFKLYFRGWLSGNLLRSRPGLVISRVASWKYLAFLSLSFSYGCVS